MPIAMHLDVRPALDSPTALWDRYACVFDTPIVQCGAVLGYECSGPGSEVVGGDTKCNRQLSYDRSIDRSRFVDKHPLGGFSKPNRRIASRAAHRVDRRSSIEASYVRGNRFFLRSYRWRSKQ